MGMFGSAAAQSTFKTGQKGGPLQIADPIAPLNIMPGDQTLPPITPPLPQQGGGIGGFLGKIAPFAGIIGDALSAANGRPGVFGPMIQQQRLHALESQDAQARWQQQYDYERAHPKPVNNDTANDYAFWQQHLTPEQFEQWKQKNYDPVVSIPLGNGSVYTGPRSQMGAAMGGPKASAPQPGAVEDGYRFKGGDPADPRSWEPAAGGPTPPASGGFPDPMKAPGHMTSGRRTVAGNAAVGGVAHSHHLDGDAADYVGTNIPALRGYFGAGARYLDEGNHIHVTLPGYGRVPFFGRNGTR